MKLTREDVLALVLLGAVLAVNSVALWPELSISRVDLNDNVFHFSLIERMVQTAERGESPLDNWSSEWSLGYPVLRTYQPLAHALVVVLYFASGKSVDLMTIFVWVRFLSVVLLPLSFYLSVRLMGLPSLTAAAAALLAPLISTNFLYGVEFGSYTWAGSGLFPQAVASHLLLITLGLAFRAIRQGRYVFLTGAMLGLTCLAHLIYGYMAAWSIVLLVLIPAADIARVRVLRALCVGAAAALLAAFQLVPLLADSSNINHSRWEPVWKWDSFGAAQVLKWLFTGELLDHGRLPVLTVLALGGIGLFVWNALRRGPAAPAHAFAIAGAVLWTLMFFGRSFWGPLLTLLAVSRDMQLHRVIGGAQIFLVLLAAIGLAELWRTSARRWHVVSAVAITALLLYPMLRERAVNLSNNRIWGQRNLAAYQANRQYLDVAVSYALQQGGRAYSGLAASWGGQFKVGDVPFYAFLSEANVPAVAFLYHSMALTSDIMVRFNEWNPIHYQLFNIHTVVAPAGNPPMPPFLVQHEQIGPFRIFDAPPASYFDVVDVIASVQTTRNNFYDVNDRWLQSDWVLKRAYLWLDRQGDSPPQLLRLAAEDALPQMPVFPAPGKVESERRDGETYRASIDVNRPAFALFKMTWHQNWRAYIDGKPEKTAILSPGFVGVSVPVGRHEILMRYRPENHKGLWAFAGLLGFLLLLAGERRGLLDRLEKWKITAPSATLKRRLWITAGLILLALPVCIPLFTGSVLWGHDAFAYFPRLVEVHQNIIHGNLLPRWAPDLGRGTGQPLFLFHPPMIYYFGEFWHLLGFDVKAAMNLACALVVLASAASMFLLASFYFGDLGGWLGAAAYVYAPYFAVDLYVRSAMEEFAAFPFFALALYGFGAYARLGKRKHWVIGVASYAAVLLCHFPAALLFTPLLFAFLGFTACVEKPGSKSWTVWWNHAIGFALALGIAAFVWLPALAARQDVSMNRALEGNGKYSNHFVYLHQLFYSPWGYGFSVPGPDDGMSFALGWSHLLLALLAWVWLSRAPSLKADKRLLRFFAAAAAILCVLLLEDALWFWQQMPILQNVQLPWRLLGPVAVCLSILVAPLGKLLELTPRWRSAGMTGALALLIVPNLAHLRPSRTVDVDLAFWTPQELARRGVETTTMAEVTPRWITGLPLYRQEAATVLSGDAQIASTGRAPFQWTSHVKSGAPSTLEMPTAWFPGWEVRVDGRQVPAGPGTPSGLITFQVPPGEHDVNVHYGRTAMENEAAGISISALILAIVLARFGAKASEIIGASASG